MLNVLRWEIKWQYCFLFLLDHGTSLLDFEKDLQQQMVVKDFFKNKFKLEYHEDEIIPSQSVTASPPSQRMDSQEEPRASVPILTSPDRIYSLPTAPPTTFAHQVARRDAPRASLVPSEYSDLSQNQDELPPHKRAEKRKTPEVSDGESERSSFSHIRSSSERDSESGASESGSSSGSEHKGGDSSSDEEDAPVVQRPKKAKVAKQPKQGCEFKEGFKAQIDQQVVDPNDLAWLKSRVNERDVVHKCDVAPVSSKNNVNYLGLLSDTLDWLPSVKKFKCIPRMTTKRESLPRPSTCMKSITKRSIQLVPWDENVNTRTSWRTTLNRR